MTNPTDRPAARRPWLWACGGCAVLAICVVLLLAADGAYWFYKLRVQGGDGAAAQSPGDLRAEWEGLPAGDASRGEQVFSGEAGCSACHSLQADVKIVGPSLAGVAQRAATRKADFPAELYLYESITHPEAYVVDGFQAGIMPGNFRQRLTEQQQADLIAFLMTR
jgi:cytochrome c2